jgi:hypothetical protein
MEEKALADPTCVFVLSPNNLWNALWARPRVSFIERVSISGKLEKFAFLISQQLFCYSVLQARYRNKLTL